ncbi:MAG: hypothetical protein ACTHMD_05070 [Flavisolibacter sp.]|jgi:hypothetical protein
MINRLKQFLLNVFDFFSFLFEDEKKTEAVQNKSEYEAIIKHRDALPH